MANQGGANMDMKVECKECEWSYYILIPKDGFEPVKCVLCGSVKITVSKED